MIYITKDRIDETWQDVGAMTGEQALRAQKIHKKAQRELTVCIYKRLLILREDAASVGIYVFHVVLEAFSRALPRPARVQRNQIELALGNEHPRENLSPEKFFEQSPEPYALRYVHEALTEDADDVALSDHEREHIFGVLQAAIICLHEACERE